MSYLYSSTNSKDIDLVKCNGLARSDETNMRYANPDGDYRGVWTSGDLSVGPAVEAKIYEIELPSGRKVLPSSGYCWRLDEKTFQEYKEDNRIWFGEHGDSVPRIKRFLSEVKQGITPMTIWKHNEVGHSQEATQTLKLIFEEKAIFDYPKPIGLIKRCLQLYSQKKCIVLDFFSGSATTAHAVMQLNAEDGGNRRFIMVQLPEPCAEKTEAYKAGYQNICEIGKERIRRAGEKIKQEIEAENAQLKMGEELKKVPDIGFKVFKLDSSNLKKWQPDYDDFNQSLLDSIDNYVEGRTELDVVYEIMLKMGLELTYPLETYTVKDKNIYVIAYGALMICLDNEITTGVAHEMIRLHEEYQPEIWQVVFKDNGFASDSVKTNIKEMLKVAGLDEDAFTTI